MKSIKIFLTASALATVAGAAHATVWNVEMNASVYFSPAHSLLNMTGFTGTWDDLTNLGSWKGTTKVPGFDLIMHYNQTFSMSEGSGAGTLNPLDNTSCIDNSDHSACNGFYPAVTGTMRNTVVNPPNLNAYKTPVSFTPSDGWTGQWTLQAVRLVSDQEGNTSIQYSPIPMNVTLHAVPIPTAAWLFGSGLIGLACTKRRRAR